MTKIRNSKNKIRSMIKNEKLRFGRDQCAEAVGMTGGGGVSTWVKCDNSLDVNGNPLDPDCNADGIKPDPDSPIRNKGCRGGNIQCYKGECGISSCRLVMPGCFPCTPNGCNSCQNASIDSSNVSCGYSSGGGGTVDDPIYCASKSQFCSPDLSTDDMKKCLIENDANIRNTCNTYNVNNTCGLNIDAEIQGASLCSGYPGYTPPGPDDKTSSWPEQSKNELFIFIKSLIEVEVRAPKDEDGEDPTAEEQEAFVSSISSCITNKITKDYTPVEYTRDMTPYIISIMVQECAQTYETIKVDLGLVTPSNVGDDEDNTSTTEDDEKFWEQTWVIVIFVILLVLGVVALIYFMKKMIDNEDTNTVLYELKE